jgi:hypothetical protein
MLPNRSNFAWQGKGLVKESGEQMFSPNILMMDLPYFSGNRFRRQEHLSLKAE